MALDQTASAVIDIWDITCSFVKKNRNPSYRILRNKYGIQELVLEKRLFSEYYHYLMNSKTSTATTITESKTIQATQTVEAGTQTAQTPVLAICMDP